MNFVAKLNNHVFINADAFEVVVHITYNDQHLWHGDQTVVLPGRGHTEITANFRYRDVSEFLNLAHHLRDLMILGAAVDITTSDGWNITGCRLRSLSSIEDPVFQMNTSWLTFDTAVAGPPPRTSSRIRMPFKEESVDWKEYGF